MTATSTILLSIDQFSAINLSLHNIVQALQNQSFFNGQLFAAVVGAFLGLLPSLYVLYKDRPRIKIKTRQILTTTPAGGLRSGFSISIYNHGRRPIILKNVYLKFKDEESLVFMDNSNFVGGNSGLPKTLTEGDSHMVAVLAGEIAFPLIKKQQKVGKEIYPEWACYENAVGKVYKCKTSEKFWKTMFAAENQSARTDVSGSPSL